MAISELGPNSDRPRIVFLIGDDLIERGIVDPLTRTIFDFVFVHCQEEFARQVLASGTFAVCIDLSNSDAVAASKWFFEQELPCVWNSIVIQKPVCPGTWQMFGKYSYAVSLKPSFPMSELLLFVDRMLYEDYNAQFSPKNPSM